MSVTGLRWIGAGVLLFNLWLCGSCNITGVPLLLLTVGFAVGFEFLIVRPMARQSPPAPADEVGEQTPD